MSKLICTTIAFAAFALFNNSCNNASKNDGKVSSKDGHEVPLGMLFENKNKLAGIPLASTPFGGDELPTSVDLSSKMPAVGNQGNQQSCVAWAIAYALKSYQEKVEQGQEYLFSPSYIYNQINNGINAPTYVTDALNLLSEQGVCPYNDMPYVEADFTSKPSEAARQDAKKYRIDFWRQVNVQDLKEVKAQLSAGYPVIIGAEVSKEFIDGGFAKGASYVWNEAGAPAGGHCMLLVGYDDAKSAFKVMNSWGKEWGDNGYSWIAYSLAPNVIKYGFVAKDAVTTNPNMQNSNDQNNNNPDPGTKNNNDNYNSNTQDYTSFEQLDFKHTNVEYDVKNPNDPEAGNNMKISGVLDIPPAYGKKFQIVIHIYDAATKKQVRSLKYPTYADVNHFAASYTPEYDISPKGFRHGTWWVDVPYSAIDMPHGKKSYFYAKPTLFIDGFGVAYGDQIDFYVDMP